MFTACLIILFIGYVNPIISRYAIWAIAALNIYRYWLTVQEDGFNLEFSKFFFLWLTAVIALGWLVGKIGVKNKTKVKTAKK